MVKISTTCKFHCMATTSILIYNLKISENKKVWLHLISGIYADMTELEEGCCLLKKPNIP